MHCPSCGYDDDDERAEDRAERDRLRAALLICRDYLDLSLGSPAYAGPSPYAAIQSALGTGHDKHKIEAEIEVKFHLSGAPDDEREVAYPRVMIEYSFSKGSPAVMYQRNGDPGWPAEPAEVEALDAKLIDGDGLYPTADQVWQWAQDWIDGEGYDLAVENAIRDYEPED